MVSRYGSPNGHWANTLRRPVRRPDANPLAGQLCSSAAARTAGLQIAARRLELKGAGAGPGDIRARGAVARQEVTGMPGLVGRLGDRPAALVPRAQIARPWGVLQKFTSFNHCDEKARGTIQYRPSREGTVPCRTSKCSPQNHAIALIDYQLRCTRARNRTIGVHIIGSFEPPGGTVEARTSAMIRQ
jgi:hypothetical protein